MKIESDVEKAAFLRVKEHSWRQHRLAKDQEVPASLSFEQKPKKRRPKFTNDELQKEMEQMAANESYKQYLQRLTDLHGEIMEFNAMLALEGEDCWDDESDDNFELEVQHKVDEMHLERSTCKKATTGICSL